MKITHHISRLPLLAALAGALLTVPTHAVAAPKAPAPKLTIDEKICKSGAAPEERFAVVTATAFVGATADRAAVRFGMQQKNVKGRWVNVLDIGGTFGNWEVSEPGRDGLRFAKTINGLGEGIQYRIVVSARGLDSAGKVSTGTARRYVLCTQPQVTPHVKIQKLTAGNDPSIKPGSVPPGTTASSLVIDLRNTGRSTSGPVTITLRNPTTGEEYARVGASGIKARATSRVVTARPQCSGRIEVVVRENNDDSATPAADQVASIACAPLATPARHR